MTSNQTEADGEAPDTEIDSDLDTGVTADPQGGDDTLTDDTVIDDTVADDAETGAAPLVDDEAATEATDLADRELADPDDSVDDDASTDSDADDGATGDPDHDPYLDEDDDAGPSRLMLVVGAVVAFVAIAIVGVLIASGGDSGGGGGGEADDTTAADARTDVGIFGTTDQFDRPNSATSLGDFAPGRPWVTEESVGTWGIQNDEARLVESSEFRNHAVVGLGQGDGGSQVRLDKVVNGAGLVFRYVGPYNYWAVVAVPDVATWNLIKVVDGDQEVVGNTGQSPTADGTTVAVRLRGDTIEVIINGRIRKTVVDDFQMNAGKVGMTVRGPDATDARFDDFVAGLPGGVPLRGGRGAAPGAGGATTTTAAP